MDKLLEVDTDDWKAELPLIEEHYSIFGDRLPRALQEQLEAIHCGWYPSWAAVRRVMAVAAGMVNRATTFAPGACRADTWLDSPR
jgi:hypothetical protein